MYEFRIKVSYYYPKGFGLKGALGSVVEAGRSPFRFPMRSLDFSIHKIPFRLIMALGQFILSQKRVPGIFLGVKGSWPARKADIFAAICESMI
jgi:hypothetical protein